MSKKQKEGITVGVGGIPIVVITQREKQAVKASNKLYAIIGNALETGAITGLEFRLAKAALMLIENLVIKRFSIGSVDDSIDELNSSIDVYNSFEDFSIRGNHDQKW